MPFFHIYEPLWFLNELKYDWNVLEMMYVNHFSAKVMQEREYQKITKRNWHFRAGRLQACLS